MILCTRIWKRKIIPHLLISWWLALPTRLSKIGKNTFLSQAIIFYMKKKKTHTHTALVSSSVRQLDSCHSRANCVTLSQQRWFDEAGCWTVLPGVLVMMTSWQGQPSAAGSMTCQEEKEKKKMWSLCRELFWLPLTTQANGLWMCVWLWPWRTEDKQQLKKHAKMLAQQQHCPPCSHVVLSCARSHPSLLGWAWRWENCCSFFYDRVTTTTHWRVYLLRDVEWRLYHIRHKTRQKSAILKISSSIHAVCLK